nr:hypothetical protein [Clostridia bacterium]
LKRKLERVALEYIPKVNKYIATFNNLFERKIVLTTQISKDGNDSESESNEIAYTGTDTNTTSITNDSSNSENTYYLNPVTSATQNLKVDNVESTSVSRTYNDSNQLTRNTTDTESKNRIKTNNELITENKDTLLNLLGKTNTSLLEEIMNLKNIYLTALDEFEDIFMTIY